MAINGNHSQLLKNVLRERDIERKNPHRTPERSLSDVVLVQFPEVFEFADQFPEEFELDEWLIEYK